MTPQRGEVERGLVLLGQQTHHRLAFEVVAQHGAQSWPPEGRDLTERRETHVHLQSIVADRVVRRGHAIHARRHQYSFELVARQR